MLWFLTVRELPVNDKFMFKREKNHFQEVGMSISKPKVSYKIDMEAISKEFSSNSRFNYSRSFIHGKKWSSVHHYGLC